MTASPLAIFATVLGKCFVTAFAPGIEDKHCFTSVYDGAHVRDVHVVTDKGKAVYSGETIYSATPAGLVFTYFNSSGGSGGGTATVAGGVMRFTMEMRGSAADAPKPFSGTWTPIAGGYEQDTVGEGKRRFTISR